MSITVCTSGNWDYFDSYGLITCQLAKHLEQLGETVCARALGKVLVDNQPPEVRAIIERDTEPSPGGIVIGYPPKFGYFGNLSRSGPRIAITMFESSKIPQGWSEALNECDAVIVPSQFCADVFQACGVTKPIRVASLGIGDIYRHGERSSGRPLTFLAFLDRGGRKGGMVALQAFLRAFGDDPAYRLILKGRTAKEGRGFVLTNPNVEVIQCDMSEADLYRLYLEADVMVNPNMGEGFGLLPREFAATGGIALTTDWGGTADHLDKWGWPLPYTLKHADWYGHQVFDGQDLGDWAVPDVEGIADCLRDVARRIDHYRSVAQANCSEVAKIYSWHNFAGHVLSAWRELAYVAC